MFADFERDHGGAVRIDHVLGRQDVGHGAPFDELHGDEEVAVDVAVLVDLHHARIEVVQLLLDGRAAAFRLDDQLRGAVVAVRISLSATLRFSTVSIARYTSVMLLPRRRMIS